jgi:hypothetical protein
MPSHSNSEIEKHYFEQFRMFYELPDGAAEYRDKPDVIIKGSKKIGIEITNFYLQSGKLVQSEQKQGKLRKAVVEKANTLYLDSESKATNLTFGFDASHPIFPEHVDKLAAKLAALAQLYDGKPDGEIYRNLYQNEAPQVNFIYRYAGKFADSKWRIAQVYKVPLTSKDAVTAIIEKKELSARQYEQCDVYWLLIVVDGIIAAQDQEIRIDNVNSSSQVFEKVFLFHTFGHIVEATIT